MHPKDKILYYDFDEFRLDVDEQRLLKNDEILALTHKAFLTLLVLVKNAGRIVEKEEVISEIWTDSFVEESNLSQYIYVLRKILGNDPNGDPYIETITRRGFRFTASVKEIFAEKEAETENIEVQDDSGSKDFATIEISDQSFENKISKPEGENEDNKSTDDLKEEKLPANGSPQTSNRLWLQFLLIGLLITGLILTGAYFYKYRQPVSLPNSKTKSIAVLPFKTIGGENSNEKLGLGMADAIITRLNKLKRIPVRSTGSVINFTDQPPSNTARVGSELGVDAVLEGTIQRDEGRMRVSVQLIDVVDGKSIWAESFDESFTDIFTLQDKISAKVAQSLELNLTREQEQDLAKHATKNPEAFQAYQLGVYFWDKRSRESLQKAVEYFQRAIQMDPNYAQAYAGLADSYNMLGYFRFENEDEMNNRARTAAEKALSLDNNLAEAHMAMAYVQQYGLNANIDVAAQSLERAIDLSPYNSNVRVRYAWLKLSQNLLEESVTQARLAQEYDPLSHVSNNVLCGFLSFQHKYEEAIPFCEKAISISPNAPRNRLVLAKVYFFNGRLKDAIAQLQVQIDSSQRIEHDESLALLSYFYAKSDNQAEAQKILDTLKPKLEQEPILYNYFTLTNYALGKKDEALKDFKEAVKMKLIATDILRYRYDPIWDEVRADKDFHIPDDNNK